MNVKDLKPGNEYYYTGCDDWETVIYKHETINGYKFIQGSTEAILTKNDVECLIEEKRTDSITDDSNRYNIPPEACDWSCEIDHDGSINIGMEKLRISVRVNIETCIAKVYKYAHLKQEKDVKSMNPIAFNTWLMSLATNI